MALTTPRSAVVPYRVQYRTDTSSSPCGWQRNNLITVRKTQQAAKVKARAREYIKFKSVDKDVWLPQTTLELLGKLTHLKDVYHYTDADVKHITKTLKFAVDEMSGFMRKSGRPYFQHCVGMAGCLLDIGAPIDHALSGLLHSIYVLCMCCHWFIKGMAGCLLDIGAPLDHALSGLLHSIYVFGAQAQALTNADDVCELRKKVIEVVGLEMEYYVWGYTIFPRGNLDDSAMEIAREALDRGLYETTKMGPKLKDAVLGHFCNELDEFYQLDQVYSGNRKRSLAFRRNATHILNKLGYPELADKLLTVYSKQDQIDIPNSKTDQHHTKTVRQFAKKLHQVFGSDPKYGAAPRKFHRILNFDKVAVHEVMENFDKHYSEVENLCPDIPLYEPKV
ncbi:unnamed protein product [Owenia fusiformis]|uniref:Uncharacterized protein n=1 Tax=Owenia fusiformis TaxID=6347 RepID=A0A8S4NDX9_OWEFU|nr:unnamed protein product [Owenia fusiformis]